MVEAVVFDLDGTIIDSETPEYEAWQEIYREHGAELEPEEWARAVGSAHDAFDAAGRLAERTGRPLDRAALLKEARRRFFARLGPGELRPGVAELLAECREKRVPVGLATSGRRAWAEEVLARLGIRSAFAAVATADDVPAAKPDPALYRLVLDTLGVRPGRAVAIEDSPNGALAARRAGLFCVVVPNAVTRSYRFPPVDLFLPTLAGLTLAELGRRLDGRG